MTLSVIIPTYNEEDFITDTVEAVRDADSSDLIKEIIVADGQSSDSTQARAQTAGTTVIATPRTGRAAQMNCGARQASGDILYFLHADSRPPADFAAQISRAVAGGSEAGCFRLAFDDDHPLLTVYAWFTRFDVDAFRFGDQSLFIRRELFSELGGFRDDHLVMEDNEMVRRIKKEHSFVVLDDKVETSARAYREVGIVKLQLTFCLIFVLYFIGVEQETLAAIKNRINTPGKTLLTDTGQQDSSQS